MFPSPMGTTKLLQTLRYLTKRFIGYSVNLFHLNKPERGAHRTSVFYVKWSNSQGILTMQENDRV